MIHLTNETRILLATHPADFRKGIDGFIALCQGTLEQDPRNQTRFVFINKSRTMIRILAYDGSGYWLMTKRLSKARFEGWPKASEKTKAFSSARLVYLIQAKSEADDSVTRLKKTHFDPRKNADKKQSENKKIKDQKSIN